MSEMFLMVVLKLAADSWLAHPPLPQLGAVHGAARYRVNSALFRHWPPTRWGRRAHGLLTRSTVYQLKLICVSSMKLCSTKRPVFHLRFRCRSCTDSLPLSKGGADSDCYSFQSCRQSRSELAIMAGHHPSGIHYICTMLKFTMLNFVL
jgi:hypothetical protein